MLLSLSTLHAQAAPAAQTLAQAERDQKAGRFADALARVQPLPKDASSADTEALRLEAADVQYAWGLSLGDSDPVQTLVHFQAALAIDQTLRPDQAADDFNQIGLTDVGLHRYDDAIGAFRQAQALHHQAGNKAGEAVALSNTGVAYEEAGQHPGTITPAQHRESVSSYRQAIAIYRQIGDKDSAGDVFSSLGDGYNAFGQYSSALVSYQQSLLLFQQANDKGAAVGALNNLGSDYYALHQYKKALDCYQRLLPLYTQFGNGDARAGTLNRLGNTCRALGQYHCAAGFYRRALAVYRQEGERNQEAEVLANLKLNVEAAKDLLLHRPTKGANFP